jgi:antitoxin (DNA-binding transcriptional repressor) of toxin-antitoxin stability system
MIGQRSGATTPPRPPPRGEEFTITVAGRPVAQPGPARRRQWVSGPDLAKI